MKADLTGFTWAGVSGVEFPILLPSVAIRAYASTCTTTAKVLLTGRTGPPELVEARTRPDAKGRPAFVGLAIGPSNQPIILPPAFFQHVLDCMHYAEVQRDERLYRMAAPRIVVPKLIAEIYGCIVTASPSLTMQGLTADA